jgi:hypothetical protein
MAFSDDGNLSDTGSVVSCDSDVTKMSCWRDHRLEELRNSNASLRKSFFRFDEPTGSEYYSKGAADARPR